MEERFMTVFFRNHQKQLDTFVLLFVFAAGFLWFFHGYQQQQAQLGIAEKILRFHVRANSDSSADQALKLKVRDAVGSYMQQELSDTTCLAECKTIVQQNLPQIIRTAEQVIAQEGYDYPVKAQVETVAFPKRTYGDYTFPAGDYQSLNVIIGAGNGRNWWCVMYPNMCFHGSVYEVVDDDAKRSLQQVLSEDEYDAVLKSRNYKIRFKYLDFLNRFL